MKIFPVAAFCAAFVGVAGVSNAATVDFGGFAPAAVLGTDVDLGGGIVADITASGGTNQAVVFNTVPPVTGNDLDLASPFANAENLSEVRGFGNALIVQENPGNPDIIPDDVVGGSLLFEFTKSIFLYRFSCLIPRKTRLSVCFQAQLLLQNWT